MPFIPKILAATTFALLLTGCGSDAQPAAHDHGAAAPAQAASATAKSPHTTKMGNIGDTHVHIEYSAPSVRGRTIWGGLVAYDQVWSTGAHKATSVDFSKPVRVGDTEVPAGTYGFFTIPGKEQWTVILNSNYEQHLADDYDEALDLVRVSVRPEQLSGPVETLSYAVEPASDGTGAITVSWDSLRIALPVTPVE